MGRFQVKNIPNTRGPRGIFQMLIRGDDGRYDWQRPEWDLRRYAVPVPPLALASLLLLVTGGIAALYALIAYHRVTLALGELPSSLALFLSMGALGLTLGAYFGQRVGFLLRHAIRSHAILLIVLAFYAAIFPTLTLMADLVYARLHFAASSLGSGGPVMLRGALTFILLLVPTMLIGAMLPILGAHVPALDCARRRALGLLAGCFLCGGALGLLYAGQTLLPRHGYAHTLDIAFKCNLVLAVVVYLVARWLEYRGKHYGTPVTAESDRTPLPLPQPLPQPNRRLYWLGSLLLLLVPAVVLPVSIAWLRYTEWLSSLDSLGSYRSLSLITAVLGLGVIAGALLAARLRGRVVLVLTLLAGTSLGLAVWGVCTSHQGPVPPTGFAVMLGAGVALSGLLLAFAHASAPAMSAAPGTTGKRMHPALPHTLGWLLAAVVGSAVMGNAPKLVGVPTPPRSEHGLKSFVVRPTEIASARDILHTTRDKYDVIYFSTASLPDVRTLRNLTTGFLRIAAAKLSPQGCVILTIETSQYAEATLQSLTKTVLDAFPNVSIYSGQTQGTWLFVGLAEGNPATSAPLPPEQHLRNRAWLEAFAAEAQPWTDAKPLHTLPAPNVRESEPLLRMFEAIAFDRQAPDSVRQPQGTSTDSLDTLKALQYAANEQSIREAVEMVIARGVAYQKQDRKEEALRLFEQARKVIPVPHHAPLLAGAAIIYANAGRTDLASDYIVRAEALEPGNALLVEARQALMQAKRAAISH